PGRPVDLLFHHDLVVATLASGSRGNCTYVGDTRSGVLIDCGLSTKQVLGRLADIGLGDVRIDAVLVTHEHSDHVGAARILDDRLYDRQGQRVPFHLTRGTRRALDERCVPTRRVPVTSGTPFQVGAYRVEPYAIPHDTVDPVAYLVSSRDVTVGVLTDLGRTTRLVEQYVARMDVAVIEFNHDLELLMDGAYPWSLKQRVRGPHGHLSNDQAGELVRTCASSRLRHLVLAHLSEENNLPERALEAAQAALAGAGLGGVTVSVASQQLPLGPFVVGAAAVAVARRKPAADPGRGRPRGRTAPPPAPEPPKVAQLGLFA
ncbi:MAG: MBL fold metallo-hydrolase, partial [Myxococcota bacterium]